MSALPSWVWPLAVVLAVAVLFWLAIRRVPQGNECVVERAGRYRRTLSSGTHFLLPLLDHAGPLIDIRETPLSMRTLKLVTRDEIEVEIALLCFVQITDAARATYEVRDVRTAVEELVAVQVANHLAACPLGQLVTDRERALRELPDRLDRATDVWGIKVTRLDIKDVRPPAQLLQAILDETRHEHEQRTRLLEAQGTRNLELEELQRAHQMQLLKTQQEQELAVATENAAMALALSQRATAAEAARLESEKAAEAARLESEKAAEAARLVAETTEQAARVQLDAEARSQLLAQESAALQLLAARNKAEIDAELARIAADDARTRDAIAQAEQAARAALAWRESMDLAQRQREEAAQQHRRIEQEAAHAHELARMASERAAQEARAQHASDMERADAARATELAAIEHEKTMAVRRHDAEREQSERELVARVRVAELVATEAAQLARARELAAEADARSVRLLSASLQGVNAASLSYLAAREQSDALRSLGSSTLSSAAAGAAASLVANVNASRPVLAASADVGHGAAEAEESLAKRS